jgi:hypothetical protein
MITGGAAQRKGRDTEKSRLALQRQRAAIRNNELPEGRSRTALSRSLVHAASTDRYNRANGPPVAAGSLLLLVSSPQQPSTLEDWVRTCFRAAAHHQRAALRSHYGGMH